MTESERNALQTEYCQKHALIVGFFADDEALFVVAYKLTPEALSIGHVWGNWGRFYQALDSFSQSLAALCGYSQVAFTTDRPASERIAARAGYVPTPIEFTFVKKVSGNVQ